MARKTVQIDDDLKNWHLFKKDPPKYLDLCHEIVRHYPENDSAYWGRHVAWERVGRLDNALEDLNTAIRLNACSMNFDSRGQLLYRLERIEEALEDFDRAEALDPQEWYEAFGPVFRAQCHARLGNLEAALRDCSRINDRHWTPGIQGMLRGDRAEITAQVMRIALDVANRRG